MPSILPIVPEITSPVTLPPPFINPGGPFEGIIYDPTQKKITETILNEGPSSLLSNPISNVIAGMNTSITSMYDTVTNSQCLSTEEKTSIQTALGTSGGTSGLVYQLTQFSTHTQILSGLLPGNNRTPGLETVLSVGRSLSNLAYGLQGITGCLSFLNGMTGLFSEELLNGYLDEISGMIEQINSCLADVEAIVNRLNQIANQLNAIIDSDNNFFANALEQLRKAALAALLQSIWSNPCGKVLLSNRIGGERLLGFLR